MKNALLTAMWIAGSLAWAAAAHGTEKEGSPLPVATDLLPSARQLSKQELERKYQLLESRPFDDPGLAYRIQVPISWSSANIETTVKESASQLVPIGLLTLPDGAKARIGAEIGYVRVDLDINVRDWLGWYAGVKGMRAKCFRNYPEARIPSWDLLVEHTVGEVGLNTRLSAFQWGPHVFLVACTCPADQYDRYKQDFARVCDSFELTKPPEQMLASKLATVDGQVGRRRCTIRYPDVWSVAAVASPTDTVTAWQFNLMQPAIEPPKEGAPANPEVLAVMFVKLVNRMAFRNLTTGTVIESARDELRKLGFEPGDEHDMEKGELKGLHAAAEVRYLPVRKENQESEAAIAVVMTGPTALVITSVGPSPERNPYAWMVCKRALEILLNYSTVQDAPER